jgi:putative two-component system response regulator
LLQVGDTIALSHHEKWDGSGYPKGLLGESIPLMGRIVAIADVFDALTSKRPYKDAFPNEKALQIMKEGKGKHFDPALLDVFLENLGEIENIQSQCLEP